MGVATLHGLLTSVTLKTLPAEPGSVAVMAQVPCMFVEVEFEFWLLLDPQLDSRMPINSRPSTADGMDACFISSSP
jgi:hypothetical protein